MGLGHQHRLTVTGIADTAWVNVAEVHSRGEGTPFTELMSAAALDDFTTAFTVQGHGRYRTGSPARA